APPRAVPRRMTPRSGTARGQQRARNSNPEALGPSTKTWSPERGEQCRERGLLAVRFRAGGPQLSQRGVDLAVDLGPGRLVLGFEAGFGVVPLGFEVTDARGGAGLIARVQPVQRVLCDLPEDREVPERGEPGRRLSGNPRPGGWGGGGGGGFLPQRG